MKKIINLIMIVGIIIATVIALSSCTGRSSEYVDKIATYEVTFLNGDKEDFIIQSVDGGWSSETNGVWLYDGCVKARVKSPQALGGMEVNTIACNVRSFKLKPND